MREELFVVRHPVQKIRDDGGLVDKLLNPGGDGLADVDSLSHHHTNESGERQEKKADQDKESQQGGNVFTTLYREKKPMIEGACQRRKKGCHENSHEELLHHGEKNDGDGQYKEEKDGFADYL